MAWNIFFFNLKMFERCLGMALWGLKFTAIEYEKTVQDLFTLYGGDQKQPFSILTVE
jgi:hypothetical protein